MPNSHRVALALLLVSWAFGCGDAASTPEVSLPILPDPSVTLASSIDPALFRVVDADVLGDTLYLAEQSSGQIRRFDVSTGSEYSPLGGEGDGPGEFRRLQWVSASPGAVSGFDSETGWLVTFQAGSREPSLVRLQPSDRLTRPTMVGVLTGGAIIAAAFTSDYERVSNGVARAPTLLLSYSEQGALLDTLGLFTGAEIYRVPYGNGGGASTPLRFGRRPFLGVAGNHALLVDNQSPEVQIFEGASGPPIIAQPGLSVSRRLAGDQAIDAAGSGGDSSSSGVGSRLTGLFDDMPTPDSTPYYGAEMTRRVQAAHIVATGEVWLMPFRMSAGEDWRWIFGKPGGDWESVVFPSGSNLLHVGARYVVVQRWDDLDVEFIEIYDRSGWR